MKMKETQKQKGGGTTRRTRLARAGDKSGDWRRDLNGP